MESIILKKELKLPVVIKCSSIMNEKENNNLVDNFLHKNYFDILYKIKPLNIQDEKLNLIKTNLQNIDYSILNDYIDYEAIGLTYQAKYHLVRVKINEEINEYYFLKIINTNLKYNKYNKIDVKNGFIEHKCFANIKKIYKLKNIDFIKDYIGTITDMPLNLKNNNNNNLLNSFNILNQINSFKINSINEIFLKQSIFIEEVKDYFKDINNVVNKRKEIKNNEHYNEMLDNLLIELEKNNQLIIYGTAGLGKSHSIQKLIDKKENSNDYSTFRTVFHPEFSYYDFVGKILPITKEDKSITYEFQDGIFTKAYKEAIKNPNKNVYLVIDEINRGYTTGIFGDIFLLLDRKNNISEYNIEWTGLQGESIKQSNDYKLKLPKNLYIIGTMNTSDKTTIKLDKAFERRFNKYFISLQDSIENYSNHTYLEENHGTTWKLFLTNLNKKIKNDLSLSVEDIDNELIGPFFIKSTKYLNFDINSIANLFPDLVDGKYQNGIINSFKGVEFTEEEYQDLKEMILNHSIIAKSDIQYSLMYHLWYSTYADNRKQLTNSISFEDFITLDYNDFIESIINYK